MVMEILDKCIGFIVKGINNITHMQNSYNNDRYNLHKFKLNRKRRFKMNDELWGIKMVKMQLKFYDVKSKRSFNTSSYKIVRKTVKGNTRKFAVAKAPSGIESWRVLPKNFKE